LSKRLNGIILATSDQPEDDFLVQWAESEAIPYCRGLYTDPVGRIYKAACIGGADIVVKIEGSYPLIVPSEMDELIDDHISRNVSYSYSEHYSGLILGTGCEVASFDAIELLERDSSEYSRKIGISRLRDVLPDEKVFRKDCAVSRSDYRVNMAVESDVAILEQILETEGNEEHAQIVEFLDNHPWLVQLAKNSITPVKEVGLEKIVIFPDKLKSLGSVEIGRCDLTYPVSVELSLTNRCNLSCSWCSDLGIRQDAMVDLDYEIVLGLIRDLKEHGCRGVVVEGGGEPTIYKRFDEVIEYIATQGLAIGLITNGVKLPDERMLDKFSWIRVSLDASTRETFLKYKGVDRFAEVMENIHRIAEHDTICGVGYVLAKDNQNDLEGLVEGLRELGVKYVHFRPVIDHPELSEDIDLTYLQKFNTADFSVLVDALRENRVSGNADCACRSHSLSSVITADGNVYLCGRLNIHPNWSPIGNLYEASFNDIWLSAERAKQADVVLDPLVCRQFCPECRLTKYNILMDGAYKIKTKDFI
jgi:radical SAM protein with 4Fe4S-binding SPASM domain